MCEANPDIKLRNKKTMKLFFKILNILVKFCHQKTEFDSKIYKLLECLSQNELENFFTPLFVLELNEHNPEVVFESLQKEIDEIGTKIIKK